MSVKTTHIITRRLAIQIISSKLEEASDNAIADMLETFPESEYKNYTIVSEEELEQNENAKLNITLIWRVFLFVFGFTAITTYLISMLILNHH